MKGIALAVIIVLATSIIPLASAQEGKIDVVSTLPLFATIVKEVGGEKVEADYIVPPGTDIHSYSLTYEDVKKLEGADLIVLASSEFFSLDRNIKEKIEGKEILDFQNYNATVFPLGEIQRNIHGYWLYPQNARGIAIAIYQKLSQMDPEDEEYFRENLERFLEDVNSTCTTALGMVREAGMYGKDVLIAVPGVYYVVDALGMNVSGSIVKGPNQFIGGDEIRDVEEKIRKGEIRVIVNAAGLENSRAGEIAKQISKDTGVKVVYVDIFSYENYTSLLLKDASVLSASPYVEKYSQGECNVYPYALSMVILASVSIVLAFIAYRYRRELLS